MKGSPHLEMTVTAMVIVTMVTIVILTMAAVTYREPPSGGPFLNEPTTILDETLEIGRCVLRFLLPILTAAMDTPTKESR